MTVTDLMKENTRRAPTGAVGGPVHPASHAWASAPLPARLAWLAGLQSRVAAATDMLVDAVSAEVGKSRWEALATDVLPLVDSIRWHRRHAARVLVGGPVGGRPWWMLGMSHRIERVPVGHVAIIATWNYPVQLLGIQLVQALVAGNRVTVKPSERSPKSQAALLQIVAEGLPPGTLDWTSSDRSAGEALLHDRRFDHVVFTGSTEVGRVVAETCARTLTPTTLELSGCDSALVLDDADPALAARGIWDAVTMNAGQTCMAPRRAIVDARIWPRFVECLAPLVGASGPLQLVCAESASRVAQCVREAVASGGRPLRGVVEEPRGSHWRPAAVVGGDLMSELARGRHFGPAISVLAADGLASAIALHRRFDQHLAVSVWCSPSRARAMSRDRATLSALSAGVITFNDAVRPTAHPATSISGSGSSGWGATRGEAGLRAMSRDVSVSTTSTRMRTPSGEPAANVQSIFRRLSGLGLPRQGRHAQVTPDAAPGDSSHGSAPTTRSTRP
jgi:acyl-CoA reductase-like NAD-dependent aldehyde dehydrogenase